MASLSHIRAKSCAPRHGRVSLLNMLALYRQRRDLSRLDHDALCDLGISREDALREARRPIWDVPGHWLK